jgi:hypothetical protein
MEAGLWGISAFTPNANQGHCIENKGNPHRMPEARFGGRRESELTLMTTTLESRNGSGSDIQD